MVLICVLPQVALWGKGILCLLVAICTSLSLFFCVASFSFSSISFFEGGCGFEAKNPPFYAFFMLFNSFFFVNSRKNTTFAISLFHWKPKRVGREKDNIYIKGVSWRFEFDAIRTSQLQSVCQKQSNGNAPIGVLYAFRWLMGISCILCWCWLNIHSVGLSALLVSTNRAMRRP